MKMDEPKKARRTANAAKPKWERPQLAVLVSGSHEEVLTYCKKESPFTGPFDVGAYGCTQTGCSPCSDWPPVGPGSQFLILWCLYIEFKCDRKQLSKTKKDK